MRTLLIDGDILVVSTCAVMEVETDWGDDDWTMHTDIPEAKRTVLRTIERLKNDLKADDAIVTLSKGETFRHQISDTYKAGRGRKPMGVGELKRWLIADHGARLVPGIEADDVMGILSTHPHMVKGEKVIVSQDKDMQTIPGLLYRGGEIVEVTEGEANYNWFLQTLMGDITDGYKGCPKIGEVSARKLLDNPEPDCLWETVVKAFEKAGQTYEDALLQARLARILRAGDFNFKTKEPILWQPPQ